MRRSLLRAPGLHFLLLGLALHGLVWLWPAAPGLRLSAGPEDVAQLRRDWRAETGRWPNDIELRASVERWLDEQALLAEALDQGLDRRDPVVRARLLQNLEFVGSTAPPDAAQRLDEAAALGMPARDLVVRRRLVQLIENRLLEELPVDEAALRDYVRRHPQRYGAAERLQLQQRWFSRDRGPAAAAAAEQALQALRREPGAESAGLGDPLLLGGAALSATPSELERRYGPAFARAAVQAPAGVWSGPVETAYGWHLLRVEGREAAGAPDYDRVRARAAWAWRAEQAPAQLRARLDALRRRHGLPDAVQLLTGSAS